VSWQQPLGFPSNVEWHATADYTGWLAAPTGLFTMRTLGVGALREHNAALAAYAQQVVGEALGIKPADLPGPGGGQPLSMRVIPLPAGVATDTASTVALRDRIADDLATQVAINTWQPGGLLRLSAQVYNEPDEYERLAQRLPSLLHR
jgi:isopenicillin-N epimerase